MIDKMDMDSLNTPIHESTNKSYIKNSKDAEHSKSFICHVFLSHKETVTMVDAAIGIIFTGAEKVINPKVQLMHIKIIGQKGIAAHFLVSLFIKTVSLKMPTKFGIIPPTALKQK